MAKNLLKEQKNILINLNNWKSSIRIKSDNIKIA